MTYQKSNTYNNRIIVWLSVFILIFFVRQCISIEVYRDINPNNRELKPPEAPECSVNNTKLYNSNRLNPTKFSYLCNRLETQYLGWSVQQLIDIIVQLGVLTEDESLIGHTTDVLAATAYLESGFMDIAYISQIYRTKHPQGLGSLQINPNFFNLTSFKGSRSELRREYLVFESTDKYGVILAYLIKIHNLGVINKRLQQHWSGFSLTNRDVLLLDAAMYVAGRGFVTSDRKFIQSFVDRENILQLSGRQSLKNMATTLHYMGLLLVILGEDPTKGWGRDLVHFMNQKVQKRGHKKVRKVWTYVRWIDPKFKANANKHWRKFRKHYKPIIAKEFLDGGYNVK